MINRMFALDESERDIRFELNQDGKRVTYVVTCDHDLGIATQKDKDVLIYILTKLVEDFHANGKITNAIDISAADFLRLAGKDHRSGKNFKSIVTSLLRLKETSIRTDIKEGKRGVIRSFNWLSSLEIKYNTRDLADGSSDQQFTSAKVKICDWLFESVKEDPSLVDYPDSYFQLTSGVLATLFEFARSAQGMKSFRVPAEVLRQHIGSNRDPKYFKSDLKKAIEGRATTAEKSDTAVPGYAVYPYDIRYPRVSSSWTARIPLDRLHLVFVKSNDKKDILEEPLGTFLEWKPYITESEINAFAREVTEDG
jgi:hypothetical protein